MKDPRLLHRTIAVLTAAVLAAFAASSQAEKHDVDAADPDVAASGAYDAEAAFGFRSRGDDDFLLVWAGDEDAKDSDFLAVIDAREWSRTYGKVLRTVRLPQPYHLANEPHHLTHQVLANGFIFGGGALSGHSFMFNVRDPLNIPMARALPQALTYPLVTAPDDFLVLESGNVLATFIAAPDLNGSGGAVEFKPNGEVVGQYISDSWPHGLSVKESINRLVTTDFGRPASFFASQNLRDVARTADKAVRIWDWAKRTPIKVVELPTGPRAASGNPEDAENFAVMEAAFLNGPREKGFYVSAMGGGGLFYCPDATAESPRCHLVYDHGFIAGPGSITITADNRYLIQPCSTLSALGTNGNARKKVVMFDISNRFRPRVVSEIIVDDPTTGGPHFGVLNRSQTRFSWTDYFLDAPGIGFRVGGDHRVHIAKKRGSKLIHDLSFRDENTRGVGVDFDRMWWPHGPSGNAKPHGVVFAPSKRWWRDVGLE